MTQTLSFLFVILWSSAFITGKIIVDNGSPFASLSFRFAIVAMGFLFYLLVYCSEQLYFIFTKKKNERIIKNHITNLWLKRS